MAAVRRSNAIRFAILAIVAIAFLPRAASAATLPIRHLRSEIRRLGARLPASAAFEVLDLSSGYAVGYNADTSMPAASVIKVAVMVQVFEDLERGDFSLDRRVMLEASDKDDGSGDLCEQAVGTSYSVSELLARMIDVSDNTAANMLIRLVGRQNVNRTMRTLGLFHTHLYADIRTQGWAIRNELRTSPSDMVRLLAMMAERRLVDEWSSNEMISLLEDDEYNEMLPEGLPDDVLVAHKTGSLFDTLNDVGIVYADGAPYVIAVLTTGLPSQTLGLRFMHKLSRDVYDGEIALGEWRQEQGLSTFDVGSVGNMPNAPDVRYWDNASTEADATGGGL